VIFTDSISRGAPLRENSCGAVVFRKSAGEILFLLLHYEEGHWGSPKGHTENNENTQETAVREIREETGLTAIRFIDGFREEITYSFRGKKGPVNKSVVFLLAETPVSTVRLSDEHTEYRWLPCAEAVEITTYADEKSVLQKACLYLLEHQP
jgi:bis(5'-nucleosidyl)-tetraphosphatase